MFNNAKNNDFMKTLSEQAQEILKGKTSVANKKQALIKLGLREIDVNNLLYVYCAGQRAEEKAKRAAAKVVNSLTFGVEIECYNAASDLIRERAQANNLSIQYEGYNHRDNHSYFKFVSDSSIQGAMPIECVTPVLKGDKGFSDLKKCCKTLNEAGCKVNKSTGLHVHVGGVKTNEHYISVFQNYKMLENVIDTFMAESRRGNNSQWCRTLQDHSFDNFNSVGEVQRELNSRYHKVNAESWSRHNTIEFRQHQGSTDFEKIKMWATFCIKLVAWSENNRLNEQVNSINDIAFLNEQEKQFFNERANHFAGVA